jgi:hypothetical protein
MTKTILAGSIAALATVMALAACGSSTQEQNGGGAIPQIKDTIKSYYTALHDGDADKACDELSGDAKRGIVASANADLPGFDSTSCPAAIKASQDLMDKGEREAIGPPTVTSVTVNGATAVVFTEGSDDRLMMSLSGEQWLIAGLPKP